MTSRKFRPGESGNPSGKKPGTRNRSTLLRAQLVTPAAVQSIASSLVEAALGGSVPAAIAVLDRVWPRLRPVSLPTPIELPDGPLAVQGQAVVRAVALGTMTADDGARVLAAISSLAHIVEVDELKRRLSALEARDGH